VLILAVTWLAVTAAAASAAGCSNEAIRVEQGSTYLPDCRAYEQVTPVDKDNGEVQQSEAGLEEGRLEAPEGMYAAVSGGRMSWTSEYSLPGSDWPGLDYLSVREPESPSKPGGWRTENVIPAQSSPINGTDCAGLVGVADYSTELTESVLADGEGQFAGVAFPQANCGHDEPRLAAGELPDEQNLLLRAEEGRSYGLIDVTPNGIAQPSYKTEEEKNEIPYWYEPSLLDASANLETVVFEEELPLTEDAPGWPDGWKGNDNLYAWSSAVDTDALVSLLPDGEGVRGILAGSSRNTKPGASESPPRNVAVSRHAVSAEGSRIFFEAGGDLYVRENPDAAQSALGPKDECLDSGEACTIQLDSPNAGAAGPGGGGKFLAANATGTKVFFMDQASAGLTSTTVEGSGLNLYEYSLPTGTGAPGTLTDLTPDSEVNVLGVAGAGEEDSYFYFVADGMLSESGQSSHGAVAQAGEPNMYVVHEGRIKFVATLDPATDFCDWEAAECVDDEGASRLHGGSTTRVSANGKYIAFNSDLQLTGYENEGPHCVPLNEQSEPILRVGSEGGEITSYSAGACQEIFLYRAEAGQLECVSCNPNGAPPVRPALLRFPVAASQDHSMDNSHLQRNVSDSGAVFFESQDPLVTAASNGKVNVYEYQNGQPLLLSSGTGEANSIFLEATPSGSDVFFATNHQMTISDTDAAYDIYDAREGGGFVELSASATGCEGETCKGATQPVPAFSPPASTGFSGGGNLAPSSAKRRRGKQSPKLTRKQELVRALDVCRHRKRKRVNCERRARKRYALKVVGARRDGPGHGNGGLGGRR
jgi:hypothetical protein